MWEMITFTHIELDVGDDNFYSNFTILLSLQPDVLTFDILSMNTARSNSKKFKYQISDFHHQVAKRQGQQIDI